MAKVKTRVTIKSFGIFTKWDRTSRTLPRLKKITTTIPAEKDIEFGMLLEIKKGKGKTLDFIIEHPEIKDAEGKSMPAFEGQQFIRTNTYEFFIGDCIWEPVNEKKGTWKIQVFMEETVVAAKEFLIV